jgi:cytochrome c5
MLRFLAMLLSATLLMACTQMGDTWVTSLDTSDASERTNDQTTTSDSGLECGTPGWGDISSIYDKACSPCHTTGMSGGTQFGSVYEDNLEDSNVCADLSIAECNINRIEEGSMPMGKNCGGPVADDAENANICVTESELETLKTWVENGTEEELTQTDEGLGWAEITPIYDKACSPCHTSGDSGGTQFGTIYEDNLKDSKDCSGQNVGQCNISQIEDGTMPLGKNCGGPVVDDAENANVCVTESELETLKAWVAEGMPE